MSTSAGIEHAAVIGLGLIGGSLARDLSARSVTVAAYDANEAALRAAVLDGVADVELDESLSGVAAADVIIVAVPVDCAVDVLRRVASSVRPTTLITDVGSTKARIVDAAGTLGIGAQFIGSHPMAGDHRSGWEASRAGLFERARVYLCPAADAAERTVERAESFWRGLGAEPVRIAADEHDRKLARASHLPHVLSAALGIALSRGGIARHDLGPGGRDVTRLAGSSPDVWTAIARENATALDAALAEVERELAEFRRSLWSSGDDALRDKFRAARAWFNAGL